MSGGREETRRGRQSGAAVFFSNPLMSDVEADWSPIHDAAFNGRVLNLQRLIAQGACVNLSTLDRVSALHGACMQGHAACAKLLLQNGADVNNVTLNGQTALSEACTRGHVTCVSLLLQHGASTLGSNPASSPLHMAAAKGYPECIESLAEHGADLDHTIDQSGAPLHVACSNQQLTTIKKLLQLGASANSHDLGDSPLHIAARLSSPEMVSVLLNHGADASQRNLEGKQPLDLAPPNSVVERLLRQSGGVPPLMQLCRLHIRRTLGKQRLVRIYDLHLPIELKDYLLHLSRHSWPTEGVLT
ncbi:ankyrin repeat and SOCS box protein 9-like isoform X1 [Nerophis ophidion]|uniref:ankyrin repeat and SOCS box protein 9-like isoform X1 n=1 Tax=Nerophis ophidion TaxID=159077 RepID=UPI002ADF0166|nr:ankyrin repeat and SOCS box protein 9-like isoform X1 [Nerophis ophidion]XP_061735106.1 ankyrin repeat and SOCS box protein 9-like isoform X1 [Nerophis ophidion]